MIFRAQENRWNVLLFHSSPLAQLIQNSSKHGNMIAAAVSFRFPGCNWLHDRDRLKRKQKGNYKTKRCLRQQLRNHPTFYTKGTDSLQQDRPISKRTDSRQWDRLKTKQKTDSTRKPGFTKLAFADAPKMRARRHIQNTPSAAHRWSNPWSQICSILEVQ